MLREQGQSHRILVRAVEVAIAAGALDASARGYGKTDLLEALAEAMGLARFALRNLYYRDEARLDVVLQHYVFTNREEVAQALREADFRSYAPLVWKRPAEQLRASKATLRRTLQLAQAAEKNLRETTDPQVELRREIGRHAAEIMACALTFFDGRQRWDLLVEGERLFKAAMAPLSLDLDVSPEDAALFARFWENRATEAGLQWSNVWDDPTLPPTVSDQLVDLAVRELDKAAGWLRQHPAPGQVDEGERVRQLYADKAKWFAKAGRFEEARSLLDRLSDFSSEAARSDALLLATLAQIAGNELERAHHTASELAELVGNPADGNAIAPVTSTILVHNIELLRGRRPALDDAAKDFLTNSPVVASEMVNLPRYRARLKTLGYELPEKVA